MNGDDGSVRNTPEGIFHRMETGDSPFYQNLGTDEIPAAAILFPLPYELLREDGHDPDSGDSFEKALDSQLEYRLAGELQELLGQSGAHTGPMAARGDKEKFFYGAVEIHYANITFFS